MSENFGLLGRMVSPPGPALGSVEGREKRIISFVNLREALAAGEGQRVEFKESLRLAKEGMQAALAFANAQGGEVFFGVRDRDLRPLGVDIGNNTLEDLANQFQRHIYPSLPIQIVTFDAETERHVIRVTVPGDVPPLIGAYLFSDSALDQRQEIDARGLQAYRRVGRTSQKVDFMAIRQPRPSDPVLLVDVTGVTRGGLFPTAISGVAWLPDGSAVAHNVLVRLEPPAASPRFLQRSLPRSDGIRSSRFELQLTQDPTTAPRDRLTLIVECRDEWGVTWEFGRLLVFKPGLQSEWVPTGEVYRRITRFPPKMRIFGET